MAQIETRSFSVVGQTLPRVDAREKVTGSAEFVADEMPEIAG